MKKILYLTYNDAPSGIYSGQVIDVCRFWKEQLGMEVSLLAFVSIRGFKETKSKIKADFPNAIVLPMFPKAKNWRLNKFLLRKYVRKINPKVIVARGPFATVLAQEFQGKRKICFDGRGAYAAELSEYNVVPDAKVKAEIHEIEKQAVLQSDYRLAVSNELVNYWKKEFNYSDQKHVVVPCTLNGSVFKVNTTSEKKTNPILGAKEGEVLLVYSGSSAEWQSFEGMDKEMHAFLSAQKNLRIILLAKPFSSPLKIQQDFSDRVKQLWVKPNEVSDLLQACDYGWLVREYSVTNLVASPVKFGEYLSCGLKVIVSENLGDFSQFVQTNDAGMLYRKQTAMNLLPVSTEEKDRMKTLAKRFFFKEVYKEEYLKLLE